VKFHLFALTLIGLALITIKVLLFQAAPVALSQVIALGAAHLFLIGTALVPRE